MRMFGAYGKNTRVPLLWLYGPNDSIWPVTLTAKMYERHADISPDEVERIHLQTGARMGMLIPHLDPVAPNAAQTRRPASGERTGGPETVKGQDLTTFLSEGTFDAHLLLTLTPCCGAV